MRPKLKAPFSRPQPNQSNRKTFGFLVVLLPCECRSGIGAALAPCPARLRTACPRRTPLPKRVKGERAELAGKFLRSEKFSGSSGRTLTRKEAGVLEVPGIRGSHVQGTVPRDRFPPRPPMRRAATTRSEALRGGKRERRQSTRVPHGALSVGRWAGGAGRRGRKGRVTPCRLGGCREPRRKPVPCLAPGTCQTCTRGMPATRRTPSAMRPFGSPRDSPARREQQKPPSLAKGASASVMLRE